MKRFSVICIQCGLNVHRLIDVETTQTEIPPETYQQKCQIAPNAAEFDCPELKRAVERSRRWDPIFQGGMSRPASSDDTAVFSEALSETAAKNWKLVAEKAELSAEAADLRARTELRDALDAAVKRVGISSDLRARTDAVDMVSATPTTPDDVMLDELRAALDAAWKRVGIS